jgi:hypothetical protein
LIKPFSSYFDYYEVLRKFYFNEPLHSYFSDQIQQKWPYLRDYLSHKKRAQTHEVFDYSVLHIISEFINRNIPFSTIQQEFKIFIDSIYNAEDDLIQNFKDWFISHFDETLKSSKSTYKLTLTDFEFILFFATSLIFLFKFLTIQVSHHLICFQIFNIKKIYLNFYINFFQTSKYFQFF